MFLCNLIKMFLQVVNISIQLIWQSIGKNAYNDFIVMLNICMYNNTPDSQQWKTSRNTISKNVDQKWLDTEIFIAICRLTGDK